MLPTVALIGRPNVGKSTLFNRLVGKRLALVDDTPGVTRDRREGEAKLGDLTFQVIDTAGLEDAAPGELVGRMRAQTERAIAEADASLFILDGRAGVTPLDRQFAETVRRSGRKVLLVVNKAEGRSGADGALEAYELGLGDPIAISAEHGEGMADLYAALEAALDLPNDSHRNDEDVADDPDRPLHVAIVGRPNAGKSTLVNRLIGDERLLTGPEAGITRDTIAIDWSFEGRAIRLFDTAGMRRKARVQQKLEKLSVADALRAIRFADCVIVLMDADMPFEKQDLQIADLIVREGRAVVFGLNKWDAVADKKEARETFTEMFGRLLPQVRGAPLVTLSGEKGQGTNRLMRAVLEADKVWNRRISTAALNRWLSEAVAQHPPPAVSGRRLKLRYMTQVKARPPTFALFTSRPDALPESYQRYLVNSLREVFELPGVPIRIVLRKGDNPYAGKAKKKR